MPRLLLLFTLWVSAAQAVQIGQTWTEIEAELGKPISQLEAGGRSIGRWADLEVTFVDGRVKSFLRRDLSGEAASEARRKEDTEKARRRAEVIESENRRLEEERLAQEERDRPERERRAQADKIAELEAQIDAERRKLQAMTAKMEVRQTSERNARMTSLRKELSTLRLEIQRARTAGETERVTRLRGELLAKESELNLLAGQAP